MSNSSRPRRLLAAVLLLLGALSAMPLFAGRPATAAEAEWIWAGETGAEKTPIGRCFCRKTFELHGAQGGRIEISGDNSYELFVNGRRFGAGSNWSTLDRYDLAGHLVDGKNVIAIVGANSDGPAGLVARVIIKDKAGAEQTFSTDASWRTSTKSALHWRDAKFDDSSWLAAHAFGPLGKTGPWGGVNAGPLKTVATTAALAAKIEPFELRDHDRVVMLGGTFVERDQTHGYLESLLTSRFHKRNLLFRNLGWSGDTVWGDARAGFGSRADGFKQLHEHVAALKPTVILVHYGMNESFAGEAGLEDFISGLDTLLATLAATKARIVLLSPLRQEDLGRPLPDPKEHNAQLELYGAALKSFAAERGYLYADFHDLVSVDPPSATRPPLTDNEIHLTAYGYWKAAPVIERALGLPYQPWRVELTAAANESKTSGVEVTELKATTSGLKFRALDTRLPLPAAPKMSPKNPEPPVRLLSVGGLPSGNYTLLIDGKPVAKASEAQWNAGVQLAAGPEFDQAETLRQRVVAKNQLYFYRWRPENETYLFGFRKHEQGQNAKEIPQFDPLIEAAEGAIHQLAAPTAHEYELKKSDN